MTRALDLFTDMKELFDDVWRESPAYSSQSWDSIHNALVVPTDMYVNNDTKDVAFQIALAGYPKDNISLTTEGDYLIVEASVDEGQEDNRLKDFTRVVKGIRKSKIKQRFYVPQSRYDTENIEAHFDDGLLTIVVRANESEKRKQIPIL